MGQAYLSDQHVIMIRDYLAGGGNLLVIGPEGTLNQDYERRDDEQLAHVLESLFSTLSKALNRFQTKVLFIQYPHAAFPDILTTPGFLSEIKDYLLD